MKDIKLLYLAAKNSKTDSAITEYSNAVHQLFESDPINYITNLEYIIESSIGLETFKPFIEKYGISVSVFDRMHTCFENCIQKCKDKNKDASLYEETLTHLDDFYNKYSNCFHMYEYFKDEMDEKYPKSYYSFTEDTQNKKLIAGMITNFGEGAIPDAIITADQIGSNAINQAFKYLNNSKFIESKTMSQWITECSKDVSIFDNNPYLKPIIESNLDSAYEKIKDHETKIFRESVISENNNLVYEYSGDDLHTIEDLISFKEYMITAMNDFADIHKLQEEVTSLYNELDGLITESVADSVISMLPFANIGYHHDDKNNSTVFGKDKITGYPEEKKVQTNITPEEEEYDQSERTKIFKHNKSLNESTWMNNTHNKKTGEAPGYLKNNHDISYGEDDDENLSLDDFKRPSTTNSSDENKIPKNNGKPESDEILNEPDTIVDDLDDDEISTTNGGNKSGAVNNYYYYNYQNSMNRNNNSFNNKDSYNKGNNYSSNKDNNSNPTTEIDKFSEGFTDIIKKGINKIKSLIMKKSLANLQKFDDPKISLAKKVPTLIGTNIPLKLDEVKIESTSVVEKDIFTESVECADTLLSKKEFKSIIKNLSNKFNTDIVFIDLNKNKALSEILQAAALIQISKKDLMKYKITKTIDLSKLANNLAFDPNRERVIFVNKDIIETFKITKPRDLELILTHEYGHALTYNQLTADDWLEYNIKRNIISAAIGIYFNSPNYTEKMMDANVYYHKLKPERIANEAVGINPIELLESIYKRKFIDNFKEFDFDYLVNWKISENILKVNANPNSDKNTFIKAIDESVELYKHCIRDPKIFESFINASNYQRQQFENSLNEKVSFNESNDGKPESDHPIRDTMMDIDKNLNKTQQSVKRKVQDAQNVGKMITKPINRTKSWISNMVMNWKDADENKIKERMADPHARKNLYSAIKKAISVGALAQAGILFNPIFLFLSITKKFTTNRNTNRIRSEMIGEIKTELEILDEKINDARNKGDDKQKYQMMRMKNELTKKLLRVGGSPLSNEKTKVFGVSKLI